MTFLLMSQIIRSEGQEEHQIVNADIIKQITSVQKSGVPQGLTALRDAGFYIVYSSDDRTVYSTMILTRSMLRTCV